MISTFPPVLLDVALVVGSDVLAADVERTLRAACGPLLESIRLFDVYSRRQIGWARSRARSRSRCASARPTAP